MAKKKKQQTIKPQEQSGNYPVYQGGVEGYTDPNGTWHPGKPPE